MTKEEAIKIIESARAVVLCNGEYDKAMSMAIKALNAEPRWIPVTEKMPERDRAVLITWVNHKPMSYYADIKDVPFTAVAVWHGIWYWWSVVCEDFLLEYGRNEADEIDKDVEVIAWMPLPEPYREVEE